MRSYAIAAVRIFWSLVLLLLFSGSMPVSSSPVLSVTLPEGHDFATRVLGDPWDMQQFSDISKGLNNSGRANLVQNFQTVDGIFSADSTDANYAQFYSLFPGYVFGMDLGKVGANYPIDSSTYHCLYIRMRVDSSPGDSWYAVWLASQTETVGDGNGGQLWGTALHDDTLPAGSWRIYSVDLANPPGSPGYFYDAWTSRSQWMGLRIHPTNTANAHFEVDWVRLTDCAPVQYQISWTVRSGQSALWAGIDRQEKDIFITSLDAAQDSYTWDVQGLEPGRYEIGVEADGQVTWLPTSLVIEPAPVAEFTKPSPYSGEDFAASVGNPWDFSGEDDLLAVRCSDWFVNGGLLDLTTAPPEALPPSCRGSIGEADALFWLDLHGGAPLGSEYRYLSFRHKIDGDMERTADGMIGRWLWRYDSCTQVSEDIPYDIGWHTYTIDLHDPALGLAEESVDCGRDYWANSGPIEMLRFDPNENWTGHAVPAMTFHQQFDWITLTKVDAAQQGSLFYIQMSLNKPPASLTNVELFYTTDPAQPTQHVAQGAFVRGWMPASSAPSGAAVLGASSPDALFSVFLPLTAREYKVLSPVPNEIRFRWDTAGVAPGTYYTCAVLEDGYNQSIYCSEAPVVITP